jgi:hypothetical protein
MDAVVDRRNGTSLLPSGPATKTSLQTPTLRVCASTTQLLRHHPYSRFLKVWPRLVVMVVLLAPLPFRSAGMCCMCCLSQSKSFRCISLTSQMDAPHTMTQLTIRTHRSHALPHHLHQFPRQTDSDLRLALVDPIQILRRFLHRIVVMLLMLRRWRNFPELLRNGGR